MRADDPRHGTEAGNEQHARDGETPCDACYDAKLRAARRRTKRKTMGHRYRIPAGNMHALVAELHDRGASDSLIAEMAGIVASQVWRIRHGGPDSLITPETYNRLATMKRGRIVTPLGITRRLQALMWLGYSAQRIADASEVHVDTIRDAMHQPRVHMGVRGRDAIADLYDRLSMKPATWETKQEGAGVTRARNTARRNGWAPPLAWDDIDADRRAHMPETRGRKAFVDHAAVERRLAGDRTVRVTAEEAAEVCRRAYRDGRSTTWIEERTGLKPDRYFKVGEVAA